jgi:hypothetical protein
MPLTVNPYESPRTADGAEACVFRPRILPRDATDWLLGLSMGLPIGGAIVGGFMWLSHRFGLPIELGLIPALSIAIVIFLAGIQRITVHDTGLELHRKLGSPRFVEWSDLHGIRRASRAEVFWASVFQPQRICSLCLSFRDQYRMDWRYGYFYYPPRELEAFLEAVSGKLRPPSLPTRQIPAE